MRSFQKISSCALLALSLLTPAVASASPQQAKALADIEAKGLSSVGSERLESMIASANAASDVEFTRPAGSNGAALQKRFTSKRVARQSKVSSLWPKSS